MTRRASMWLLIGVTLAAVFTFPRIPQSQEYHDFADRRTLLGIPNCLNVISNAPFLLVGMFGLLFLWQQNALRPTRRLIQIPERWSYGVFFLGIGLTALGSAYYHLAPGNGRLVWDRLPMTLAFMSFLAAMFAERIGPKVGLRMLWPLVGVGFASVVYWDLSEQRGMGDLRPMGLCSFIRCSPFRC